MSTLNKFAAFLLDHWQFISTVTGATLTGIVTRDWKPFVGVIITGLAAFNGAPKAAAFSAHLKKRAS